MDRPLSPGNYIAMRGEKEQVVTIRGPPDSNGLYECDYGLISFHETYCRKEQIRTLTAEEVALAKCGKFWLLPQQFYQSGPPGMPSMDAHLVM